MSGTAEQTYRRRQPAPGKELQFRLVMQDWEKEPLDQLFDIRALANVAAELSELGSCADDGELTTAEALQIARDFATAAQGLDRQHVLTIGRDFFLRLAQSIEKRTTREWLQELGWDEIDGFEFAIYQSNDREVGKRMAQRERDQTLKAEILKTAAAEQQPLVNESPSADEPPNATAPPLGMIVNAAEQTIGRAGYKAIVDWSDADTRWEVFMRLLEVAPQGKLGSEAAPGKSSTRSTLKANMIEDLTAIDVGISERQLWKFEDLRRKSAK